MKWTKLKRAEAKSEVLNMRITPSHLERLGKLLKFVNKSETASISNSDLIQNFIDVAYEEMANKKKRKP